MGKVDLSCAVRSCVVTAVWMGNKCGRSHQCQVDVDDVDRPFPARPPQFVGATQELQTASVDSDSEWVDLTALEPAIPEATRVLCARWTRELELTMATYPQMTLSIALDQTSRGLDHILHSSSHPIGRTRARFVYDILHDFPAEREQACHVIGGFTDELHSQLLRDFPVLQQDPLCQATYFAIQRSLEELHEKLFPLFERDWSVQNAMWQAANTQLCDTAQLGIPIKHTEWCRSGTPEWRLVVAELKEAVRSKRAGLDLLWMFKQAVINLTACAPENTVLGADDLLPLMECAVLDAKLTGFPSLVEYASRMLPKELELGEMGYLAVLGQTISSAALHHTRATLEDDQRQAADIERQVLFNRMNAMHGQMCTARF